LLPYLLRLLVRRMRWVLARWLAGSLARLLTFCSTTHTHDNNNNNNNNNNPNSC
jgi:hypothetical protein